MAEQIKTSELLRAVLLKANEKFSRFPNHQFFLCNLASSVAKEFDTTAAYLEYVMAAALTSHGISLTGSWIREDHPEAELFLEVKGVSTREDYKIFSNWIRIVFLTLAIPHYQALGD